MIQKQLVTIILLCLLWPMASRAQDYRDVVFMKNGSVINGFYKELYPGDSLRMETIDGGVFICAFKDIERIAKERTSVYVVNIQDDIELQKRVWRPAGYRGYLEYGQDTNGKDNNLIAYSLLTVHGYQFNRHVFLGAGFGMQRYEYETSGIKLSFTQNSIPLFADFQFYILRSRITPALGCRTGYTVKGLKGLYLNPSVSVDFGMTPRVGGYLSLGYSLQKYKENNEKKQLEGLSFHMGLHF